MTYIYVLWCSNLTSKYRKFLTAKISSFNQRKQDISNNPVYFDFISLTFFVRIRSLAQPQFCLSQCSKTGAYFFLSACFFTYVQGDPNKVIMSNWILRWNYTPCICYLNKLKSYIVNYILFELFYTSFLRSRLFFLQN